MSLCNDVIMQKMTSSCIYIMQDSSLSSQTIFQYSLMEYTQTSHSIAPANTKHVNCKWQTVIIISSWQIWFQRASVVTNKDYSGCIQIPFHRKATFLTSQIITQFLSSCFGTSNSLITTVHDQTYSKNAVIVKYIHWGVTDIYSSFSSNFQHYILWIRMRTIQSHNCETKYYSRVHEFLCQVVNEWNGNTLLFSYLFCNKREQWVTCTVTRS